MRRCEIASYEAEIINMEPQVKAGDPLYPDVSIMGKSGEVEFFMHDEGQVSFNIRFPKPESFKETIIENEETWHEAVEEFKKYSHCSTPGKISFQKENFVIVFTTSYCIYTMKILSIKKSFLDKETLLKIYKYARGDGYTEGYEKGFLDHHRIYEMEKEEMENNSREEYEEGFKDGYQSALSDMQTMIEDKISGLYEPSDGEDDK